MHDRASDDPLRTMRVDVVDRSDGRYLLYYAWPGGDDAADATSADSATVARSPVTPPVPPDDDV